MKDGRIAGIRVAQSRDVESMHACHVELVRDGVGMVRGPDEAMSLEKFRRKMRSWRRDFRSGMGAALVAVVAGEDGREVVAGAGQINRMEPMRIRGCAVIGIGIRPGYQELGLGRAIMRALMAWGRRQHTHPSRGQPALWRMELCVLADNTRAIALYQSLGFELEGRRRCLVRGVNGALVDDLTMAVVLGERGAGTDPRSESE